MRAHVGKLPERSEKKGFGPHTEQRKDSSELENCQRDRRRKALDPTQSKGRTLQTPHRAKEGLFREKNR